MNLNAVQAVLFDMDGTLLEPIDDGLPEYKARWGIAAHQLVVPSLLHLPAAAELEFIALEARVARDSRVRPGFHALLADLERAGVGVGIVTNNSAESVNTVLEKHELPISVVRTRFDGAMKPAPDMLFQALEILGVAPAHAVLVGDTHADAGAAVNAALRACFLMAEPWNVTLEDHTNGVPIKRVTDVMALRVELEALGVMLNSVS